MSPASVLGQRVPNFGIVVIMMLAMLVRLIPNLPSSPMNLCDNFRPLTIESSTRTDRFALCQVLRRTGLNAI